MNKKFFITSFLCAIFSITAYCQMGQPPVNLNAERDRMYKIVTSSTNIVMPESSIQELKKFAADKGYNEPAVMRNTMLLKPLFNKQLSKEDRLFAGRILLRMCENPSATIPVELVNKQIKEIQKN